MAAEANRKEIMNYIFIIGIILFIELNLYYLIGVAINKLHFLPSVDSVTAKFISGFVGYHFLFWCIAFPCSLANLTLTSLTIMWIVFTIVLTGVIWLFLRREISVSYQDIWIKCKRNKWYLLPLLLLQIFLLYYVCINGQQDVDARTYIGEITSMLSTNRLNGYNVTTGQTIELINFKHSFTMFGANSAVLCNIFKIHPLLFCRTVRAFINVIMLSITLLAMLKMVYIKSKDYIGHAIMTLVLGESMLFLFTNSIYTSAAFILNRTYEGKAYCAGVLIIMSIYLAVKYCITNDSRYFRIIFIEMIACMSISASATFIQPLVVGSIILAYILVKHKWKNLIGLVLALLPNILYIVISISGFAGFYLEG